VGHGSAADSRSNEPIDLSKENLEINTALTRERSDSSDSSGIDVRKEAKYVNDNTQTEASVVS
jgi:hypothetical protein